MKHGAIQWSPPNSNYEYVMQPELVQALEEIG